MAEDELRTTKSGELLLRAAPSTSATVRRFEELYKACRPDLVLYAERRGARDAELMADLALLDVHRALDRHRRPRRRPAPSPWSISNPAGASINPGDFIQWTCHGGDNQLFEWVGSQLQVQGSGRCLTVTDSRNGANVHAAPCVDDDPSQQFRLERYGR